MKYIVEGDAHLRAVVEADSRDEAYRAVCMAVGMWDGVEGDVSFNIQIGYPAKLSVVEEV